MAYPWYGNDVRDKEMWALEETDNFLPGFIGLNVNIS